MSEHCPICNRKLGTIRISEHHLIPKCRKGKDTEKMHDICHQKIHSVFTEKELEREYNSVDMLLMNEEIIKFVKWVRKKPIEFYDSNWDTNNRSKKRRR